MKSPAIAIVAFTPSSVLLNACCSLMLKSSRFSGGERAHPAHDPGQLVARVEHPRLVAHFHPHIGLAFGAEIFLKRRQRNDHDRIETEEPEKGALSRQRPDHFEGVAIDQDVFVERAAPGEKRIRHVVADDASFRAAARFEVVKEAAFAAIDRRDQGVIRRRAEDEDIVDACCRPP